MQRAILPSAQLRPSILELQLYLSKPWRCFTRPSQHHQSDAGFSYLGSPRSLFSTTSIARRTHQSRAPLPSASRGPVSKEDTQTDFSIMDVLSNTPAPSTSIDACVFDGFHLNSGVKVTGGAGVVLLGGEAFAWRPWEAGQQSNDTPKLLNAAKQWEVDDAAWGLLKLIWPKPGKSEQSSFGCQLIRTARSFNHRFRTIDASAQSQDQTVHQ